MRSLHDSLMNFLSRQCLVQKRECRTLARVTNWCPSLALGELESRLHLAGF